MVEETTSQYVEYLFDLPSDEDNDWMDEVYNYPVSKLQITITTRYTATGVSRSTWEASYKMGEYFEQFQDTII